MFCHISNQYLLRNYTNWNLVIKNYQSSYIVFSHQIEASFIFAFFCMERRGACIISFIFVFVGSFPFETTSKRTSLYVTIPFISPSSLTNRLSIPYSSIFFTESDTV